MLQLLQVADQLARPVVTPDSLAATGKWLPPAQLVQILRTAELQSLADLQSQGLTLGNCRSLHDAVLGCCVITHLPPLRLSCIRSLLAPDYTGPCKHRDCNDTGCTGNKLHVISTAPLLMRMVFRHHKNEHRWKKAVIEFDVPSDLAELLQVYLGSPRQSLLEYHLLIGDTCDHVFMDMHGREFGNSVFTTYWQSMMLRLGAPALNPSICRQIFVSERQSDNAVPGPSNRGAAMIMGHSVRQWHDWYDLSFHARLAQDAVNAMQVWRAAMLQVSAPDEPDDVAPNAATRCRRFIVSESESEPEPEPASQQACQQSEPAVQPVGHAPLLPSTASLQHSGYASEGSEYMSCSSAGVEVSDIEIDLD